MKNKILTLIFLIAGIQNMFAAEWQPKEEMIENISLSKAPLTQVLYIMEELTGKSVIRDSRIEDVSIDLQVRQEISKEEAIRAIESTLAMNNIAIVELGDNLLKAVDSKSVSSQSPYFIEGSLLDMKPSEKICSKIFQLKYLSVTEFSKLITQLLHAEASSSIVFEDSNSILITDSVSNLQRVELILNKVDVPKHSTADSKIFRIKHGDSKEIADLLNKVVNGQHSKLSKSRLASSEIDNILEASNDSGDTSKNALPFQFSKNITIEHDERSNSVVVCGTAKDIELVESIIEQIDVLLDQVRIEVVIAEVSLAKKQSTGLDNFGISYNYIPGEGGKDGNQGGNEIAISAPGLNDAFTINGTLKHFSMSTVFSKARDDSNVKVLSAPTIVTTHNKEATVKIVNSIPVVKADISDTASTSALNTSVKSTIEYKDIGIELKVKPLIGINGVIQMEIRQCVESEGVPVLINKNSMPTTTKREAVSFVSVCDGDAVVLAGLQEKSTKINDGKLWLLGDIPVVGKLLFSPKANEEKTKELIIFIKPTIVSNPANDEAYAKRLVRGTDIEPEVDHYDRTGKFLPAMQFPDGTLSDPTIDYSKKAPKYTRRKGAKYSSKTVNNEFQSHMEAIEAVPEVREEAAQEFSEEVAQEVCEEAAPEACAAAYEAAAPTTYEPKEPALAEAKPKVRHIRPRH